MQTASSALQCSTQKKSPQYIKQGHAAATTSHSKQRTTGGAALEQRLHSARAAHMCKGGLHIQLAVQVCLMHAKQNPGMATIVARAIVTRPSHTHLPVSAHVIVHASSTRSKLHNCRSGNPGKAGEG